MFPEEMDKYPIYAIPKLSFGRRNGDDFLEALRAFHLEFKDCFSRSEPRDHFFSYMAAQLGRVGSKSGEPGARWVVGPGARAMQRFMGDVVWNEEMLLWKYHTLVSQDLGDPEGVLIFDETSFPKKGLNSAGVARQRRGSQGRTANCQLGIFAGYASRHGYALVDKRLFMPEQWFRDDHASARVKAMVPPQLRFREKPSLAADMLRATQKGGLLPFKYVTTGPGYGNSTDFVRVAADAKDTIYFLPISSETLCRSPETSGETQHSLRQSRRPAGGAAAPGQDGTVSILTLARRLGDIHWHRHKIVQGAEGPVEYEFAKKQVVLLLDASPEQTVWLIMRRSVARNPAYTFFACNAPSGTRLETFAWLSGARWATTQCFEEARSELGMDHYEVRKFSAWNHHILTCMLAHFFFTRIAVRSDNERSIRYSLTD